MKWFYYLILAFIFLGLIVIVSLSFTEDNMEQGKTPKYYNMRIYSQFFIFWNGFNKILDTISIVDNTQEEENQKSKPDEVSKKSSFESKKEILKNRESFHKEYDNPQVKQVDNKIQTIIDNIKKDIKIRFSKYLHN